MKRTNKYLFTSVLDITILIVITCILVAAIVLLSSTAFANPIYSSREEGAVSDLEVTGSVSIDNNKWLASTSIRLSDGSASSVSVNLTCWYTNLETGKNQSIHRYNSGEYGVQVSASRPVTSTERYRIWRAQGEHTVEYDRQTWEAYTEIYD